MNFHEKYMPWSLSPSFYNIMVPSKTSFFESSSFVCINSQSKNKEIVGVISSKIVKNPDFGDSENNAHRWIYEQRNAGFDIKLDFEKEKQHVYILTLFISNDFFRQGIATKLLRLVEEDMKLRYKTKTLKLHTPTTNKGAIDFYSSVGFKVEKEVPKYYQRKNSAYVLAKK